MEWRMSKSFWEYQVTTDYWLVLYMPITNDKFRLESDTYKTTVGAVVFHFSKINMYLSAIIYRNCHKYYNIMELQN